MSQALGEKEAPFLQTETEAQTKMTHISSSHGQDASKHITSTPPPYPHPKWLAENSYGVDVPSFCSNVVTGKFITAYINVFFNETKKALFTHGDFCSNIKLYFNFLSSKCCSQPCFETMTPNSSLPSLQWLCCYSWVIVFPSLCG